MKPMGRKHFKNNTGAKHFIRVKGKVLTWWEDICEPSKKRARQDAKKEIIQERGPGNDD